MYDYHRGFVVMKFEPYSGSFYLLVATTLVTFQFLPDHPYTSYAFDPICKYKSVVGIFCMTSS